MVNRHEMLGRYVHVPVSVWVREPEDDDGYPFDEYYQTYYLSEDCRIQVHAVVDLNDGRTVPFTEYVDWYGDGGTQPSEVPMILLYKALGGK